MSSDRLSKLLSEITSLLCLLHAWWLHTLSLGVRAHGLMISTALPVSVALLKAVWRECVSQVAAASVLVELLAC